MAAETCHPYVCPIEGHGRWLCSRREAPEVGPISGPQLGDSTAAHIRRPHVGPVKGNATAPPTSKVPRFAPLLARSLVTLPSLVTQMSAPSKATPTGNFSTGKVPRIAPSLARSLVTLLLPLFAVQML